MVRYDSGFSFNGKHTFNDWGFTLKSREIGYPDKKKNTYTVPHSNNVIDFSALYGFQTYEQREIKYVLNVADINFNDPNTVNTYEMRLTNWLMQGVGQMWLVDDVFPTFHFLAEVVNGTSFKQIGANGELTISFTAYPFKIGNEFEGNDIWDTFNFDFDVSQNTTHEFRIEWDSFKPLSVGKWVHLGDWATDFSSGADISPILMGQTYQISAVRDIEKQSASLREYQLVGINSWVLEQDIVEAHNSYYDLTIVNAGTNAVAPEVVIQTGRALTAVDNNGEYFNIVNQPTNSSSFKLHPGENKIRLYGQLGNYKVDFRFRKGAVVMYRVTWHTSFNDKGTVLHDPYTDGLKIEGTIAKEINKVDNFTFQMYDQGVAEQIMPIKDYIRVYNTKTQEYDFEGRIFNISKGTDQNGAPYFEFVCEGLLGFLHDVGIGNGRAKKTLKEHLLYFLDVYNRLVNPNPEKVIQAGNLTYSQINRQLTFEWFPEDSAFEIIVNRLIGENGGELQLRREGENLYLDWLDNIGHISATPIHTGHNLLKDEKSSDFSDYGTIYVPLGAKIGDTLSRLTIREVNDGSEYLYDAGRPTFGVLMKWLVYDDVDDPAELKQLAQEDLDNQKFSKDQYTVSALDLSLNGLDIEGFKLGNGYVLTDDILQIKNEILRVVKINIDINEPQLSNVTIGDKYTDLSEFQNDRARLADYRHRQNERKFDDIEIYQDRQDKSIETNKNNIGTNAHNINVNKERIDNIIEWRDGFIERYNDLVGIVNDLVANQTPPSGGGGTDSSGYANNRVFPVDYNRSGINFFLRANHAPGTLEYEMTYGDRTGGFHSGHDIGGGGSSHPIYATTDGVVRKSEFMSGGIGNAIYIEHTADDYWSNYMHLASMSVSVGQTVKAGDQIGMMGNTGGDYAIHLHYELSPDGVFHSGGNTINPQAYLGITGDNTTSLPRPV